MTGTTRLSIKNPSALQAKIFPLIKDRKIADLAKVARVSASDLSNYISGVSPMPPRVALVLEDYFYERGQNVTLLEEALEGRTLLRMDELPAEIRRVVAIIAGQRISKKQLEDIQVILGMKK